MSGNCIRCGECCRYIVLSTEGMNLEYWKYLRARGLKEDGRFVLIPHDCQHLGKDFGISDFPGQTDHNGQTYIWKCDIHEDPNRPMICQKFHGQKRIGRSKIYIPPGCGYIKGAEKK